MSIPFDINTITLGVHSALSISSAALGQSWTNAKDSTLKMKKKQTGFAAGYIVSTTIASACRVMSACNLAFAIASPTSQAANLAFTVAKWTVTLLWSGGSCLLSSLAHKKSAIQKYMVHGETIGQALAVAITVGLAICGVIGPFGIVIGLVGPALYFASLALRKRQIPNQQQQRQQPNNNNNDDLDYLRHSMFNNGDTARLLSVDAKSEKPAGNAASSSADNNNNTDYSFGMDNDDVIRIKVSSNLEADAENARRIMRERREKLADAKNDPIGLAILDL